MGPLPSKAPGKNVAENIEEEKSSKKRKVEVITNVKRIEDKIYEGETIIERKENEEKRKYRLHIARK